MNPVNREAIQQFNREAFQQSVAANPQGWKDAIQKYRAESNNADTAFYLMRGEADLSYSESSGQFVTDVCLGPLQPHQHENIVSIHRARLLQRLVLRVTNAVPERLLSYSQTQTTLITNDEFRKRIFP